jgi:hypothetical protein
MPRWPSRRALLSRRPAALAGVRAITMVAGGTAMLVHLSPPLAALSLVLIPPVAGAGCATTHHRPDQGSGASAIQVDLA